MQAKFIKKFALSQNFRIFGCCGEIRSAPFATTFARITSASCAAASRTSHNKRICKILKSRTSSDLELHKSARTLWRNPLRFLCRRFANVRCNAKWHHLDKISCLNCDKQSSHLHKHLCIVSYFRCVCLLPPICYLHKSFETFFRCLDLAFLLVL